MNVLTSRGRLHIWGAAGVNCWCRPEVEEDSTTLHIEHRIIDRRPDTRLRMSLYSDQHFEVEAPKCGVTFA